jgi:hypothetical protein
MKSFAAIVVVNGVSFFAKGTPHERPTIPEVQELSKVQEFSPFETYLSTRGLLVSVFRVQPHSSDHPVPTADEY